MPNPPTLYLIRHAQTQGNLLGQYVGVSDQQLCAEGIITAQKAKMLMPTNIKRLYCSPMQRCRQTAQLMFDDIPINILADLSETDFGDFEEKTYEQLKSQTAYTEWIASRGNIAPPNGESRHSFEQRVISAFNYILTDMQNSSISRTACVAHGGTIMAIMSYITKQKQDFYFWQCDFCRGYKINLGNSSMDFSYSKL